MERFAVFVSVGLPNLVGSFTEVRVLVVFGDIVVKQIDTSKAKRAGIAPPFQVVTGDWLLFLELSLGDSDLKFRWWS